MSAPVARKTLYIPPPMFSATITLRSLLLVDYLKLEVEQNERIVVQNNDWIALLPYWATWPYEMVIVPRRHVLRLPGLVDSERAS
jgi:UDPglucose--hexose-1-phosphate uridylyltransferase